MDAKIGNLFNAAIKLNLETTKRLQAEGVRIHTETLRIDRKARWYPLFWLGYDPRRCYGFQNRPLTNGQ